MELKLFLNLSRKADYEFINLRQSTPYIVWLLSSKISDCDDSARGATCPFDMLVMTAILIGSFWQGFVTIDSYKLDNGGQKKHWTRKTLYYYGKSFIVAVLVVGLYRKHAPLSCHDAHCIL